MANGTKGGGGGSSPRQDKGSGSAPDRSANDDRADRYNPTSPDKGAADANEAEQAKRTSRS
jgi:hypothetical protein